MFSKATLIGIVGVEPKYKAAVDGKDSVISFRIGCEVFTSAKKIIEWYVIKAFGRVADYLYQNIKKDSFVFLETSIRNKRWTVKGCERQGIEFHAFTARVMSDSDVLHHAHENNEPATQLVLNVSDTLPFPEMEKEETVSVKQPKEPPKPLTAEESRSRGKRWRQTLEDQKKIADDKRRVAELSAMTPVAPSPDVSLFNLAPAKDPQFTGNPMTDSLLNARIELRNRAIKESGNGSYSQVRG